MTFIEYGLNIQNPLPIKTNTEKGVITKTSETRFSQAIEDELHHDPNSGGNQSRQSSGEHAQEAYRQVENEKSTEPVITASQIMSSPVVSISDKTRIRSVLSVFKQHDFRHLPVIDSTGELLGIISDRDLLHYTCAVTESFDINKPDYDVDKSVISIMRSPVLTASMETDVRYIAQLFVKQHIGALPVMKQHRIVGIISRTDILRAVMNKFKLEMWV